MNKALRKAIIAGNWKMNKNRKEAAELIEALKPIAADKTCGDWLQKTYTLKKRVHSLVKFLQIC